MLYRKGRAVSLKEKGGDHGYTGRAEQGVSRIWGVTTAVQGGQSREGQGDGW